MTQINSKSRFCSNRLNLSGRFVLVGRIAEAVIEITQKNKRCLPHDLYSLGFSENEVSEHWHLAKSIADVETNISKGSEVAPLLRGERSA